MAKKYYAVKNGRKTGIFGSWAETEKQVKGFSGAIYKGFSTMKAAREFLEVQTEVFSGAKYKKGNGSDLDEEARAAEEMWRMENTIPFNRSVRHKHIK